MSRAMVTFLDEDLITEIFDAVVASDLASERSALFAEIHPAYKGSIARGAGDASQLMIDLGSLNKTRLADGSVPFRKWLRNAWRITSQMEAGPVFKKAIAALDRVLSAPLGDSAAAVSGVLSTWSAQDIKKLINSGLPARAAEVGKSTTDSLSLITAAAKGHWLDKLLLSALAQQLGDVDLVELANRTGLLPKVPTSADNLQRILHRTGAFQDVAVWNARLARTLPAVARLEVQTDGMWKARGTAFLVGPDLVLTNYHVVEDLLGKAGAAERLRFRFDFKRATDGVKLLEGTTVSAAPEWELLTSRYSDADLAGAAPGAEPSATELDFALVRLAEPIGAKPAGPGAPVRGWLKPAGDTSLTRYAEGENVVILQHPCADPLQIAFGAFSTLLPRRVRYSTDTEQGSSGSPCLDIELNLVGLHHSGDPIFEKLKKPGYNQGIPIHLVAAMCAERGITFADPPEH